MARFRFGISSVLALSLSLPALAGDEADNERTDPDLDRAPVVAHNLFPPLPPELNCAVEYDRRDVTLAWFDTAMGNTHQGDLGGFSGPWGDDEVRVVPLPFAFDYFGARYETIAVAANGYLSFVEASTTTGGSGHSAIPDPGTPRGVIAAFWIDLDPSTRTNPIAKSFRFQTFGNAPFRAWVVTWDGFPRFNQLMTSYTFQVVLYESTNIIRFQYDTLTGDQSAMTVGIENPDGTVGFEYYTDSRGNPRQQNLARKAMEWRPVLASLDCGNAIALSCPTTRLTNQMLSGASRYDRYGCSLGTFAANEKVYRLDVTNVQRLDVRINPSNPNANMRAFLVAGCNRCSCLEGGSREIHTALGPGRYYLVVDGELASDNGTFSLNVDCTTLLGGPPGGRQISLGAAAQCGADPVLFDVNHDQAGVWTRAGWFRTESDRNYEAIRVDGRDIYSTSIDRTRCTPFSRIYSWIDPNANRGVAYWRFPQGDLTQTVAGETVGTCCGARITSEVRNLDTAPHFFEHRTLKSVDMGTGVTLCRGLGAVEGGPLQVGATDYLVEQDLSCGTTGPPAGICGLACATPPMLKSADDVTVRIIPQIFGSGNLNAVRAEWDWYGDVEAICDPVGPPDAWLGGFNFPTPGRQDTLTRCNDRSSLLYAWRQPPGASTTCAVPADCLAPGATARDILRVGGGCRLDPNCSQCLAESRLLYGGDRVCIGAGTTLDALDSALTGCPGTSTKTFKWFRDGILTVETGPFYTVDEPLGQAGAHTYTSRVSCEPPPQGIDCADSIGATILSIDCSTCRVTPDLVPSSPTGCVGGNPIVLDATMSVVSECPGTVSYEWTRDGVPLAGENGQTLVVNEIMAGTYNYAITIRCNPPPFFPPGQDCVGTLQQSITWEESCCGAQTPVDTLNVLHQAKVPATSDVQLDWTAVVMDPAREDFTIRRDQTKYSLCEGAAPCSGPPASLAIDILPTSYLDVAVPAGTYYYRVQGVSCVGTAGPY